MTIGSKILQTLANLEGIATNLQTFALSTQDQAAKQMFIALNQQIEGVSQALMNHRVYYKKQLESQPGMFQQQPQYWQPQQQQYLQMQTQQQFPRIW